ncbi:MAG TPA: hypothetical protein VK009_13075 [Chloroflexota bacterium]|nr:hypothetical protein [Chloroflexota bacterium]
MTPAELVRINIEAISLRATEETERDAFWLARFGERGHNFILEDNRYHLTYLAEALAAASPAVLENYARWLQSVLTTRGMCTRHIEDNFMQLARLLRDSLPEVAPATGSYLEQAREALIYDDQPARGIQLGVSELAAQVTEALVAGQRRLEIELYVSYLADAVHLQRPDLFASHISWTRGFLLLQGHDAGHLAPVLEAVRGAVPADSQSVFTCLDAAAAALGSAA